MTLEVTLAITSHLTTVGFKMKRSQGRKIVKGKRSPFQTICYIFLLFFSLLIIGSCNDEDDAAPNQPIDSIGEEPEPLPEEEENPLPFDFLYLSTEVSYIKPGLIVVLRSEDPLPEEFFTFEATMAGQTVQLFKKDESHLLFIAPNALNESDAMLESRYFHTQHFNVAPHQSISDPEAYMEDLFQMLFEAVEEMEKNEGFTQFFGLSSEDFAKGMTQMRDSLNHIYQGLEGFDREEMLTAAHFIQTNIFDLMDDFPEGGINRTNRTKDEDLCEFHGDRANNICGEVNFFGLKVSALLARHLTLMGVGGIIGSAFTGGTGFFLGAFVGGVFSWAVQSGFIAEIVSSFKNIVDKQFDAINSKFGFDTSGNRIAQGGRKQEQDTLVVENRKKYPISIEIEYQNAQADRRQNNFLVEDFFSLVEELNEAFEQMENFFSSEVKAPAQSSVFDLPDDFSYLSLRVDNQRVEGELLEKDGGYSLVFSTESIQEETFGFELVYKDEMGSEFVETMIGKIEGMVFDLEIVNGETQEAIPGFYLEEPLVVQLIDPSGDPAPIAGIPIEWEVFSGNGNLGTFRSYTNEKGRSENYFTPLSSEDEILVRASVNEGSKKNTIDFSIGFQKIQLEIASGDQQLGAPGKQLPQALSVQLTTTSGAAINLNGIEVHWEVSAGEGSLQQSKNTTNSSGIAQNYFSPQGNGSEFKVKASIGEEGSDQRSSVEFLITVEIGLALYSGDEQTGKPLEKLPMPFVIQLLDYKGSILGYSGIQVQWELLEGSGTLENTTTLSDHTGRSNNFLTPGEEEGNYKVKASVFNKQEEVSVVFDINVSTPALALGDYHEGGWIYYFLQPGDPGYVEGEVHGLIASTENTGVAADWGCENVLVGTSTALGSGMANTLAIVSACGQDTPAGSCYNLSLNGFNDWYLPSNAELLLMYQNRFYIKGAFYNYFPAWFYFSSSEFDSQKIWVLGMHSGFNDGDSKDSGNNFRGIRAIRSF